MKAKLLIIASTLLLSSYVSAGVHHLKMKASSEATAISRLEVVYFIRVQKGYKGKILSVKRVGNSKRMFDVKYLHDNGEYDLLKINY